MSSNNKIELAKATIIIQVELAIDPPAEAQHLEDQIIETVGSVAAANAARIVGVSATEPEVIEAIRATYTERIMRRRFEQGLDKFGLTDAEKQVTELLAEGMTTAEIAGMLSFAEGTIRNRISKILEKLDTDRQGGIAFKLLGLAR